MATMDIHNPARQQRLRRLLKRLIEIYSPSGKEEELLEYLYGFFRRAGLHVVRQPVDERRYNLVVLPPEGETKMAFLGHLDTITAYDLENLGCETKGDRFYGLGAADMKGGCAALIEAFLHLRQRDPFLPVALALVVGEEETGDGAKTLVEDYHFPWAIIGEPTDLQPCLSHYGYIETRFVTRGQRRHASLARNEIHPVQAMLQTLLQFSSYMNSHPEIVYNIRDLISSPKGFVVPERCEAWVDIHVPPSAALGEITLEIENILSGNKNGLSTLAPELRFESIHAGYELSEKEPVIEALKGVYAQHALDWRPQAFPSHSDANLLWASGIKPVLLGCGRLDEAHAPDEWVSFAQVSEAAELYIELALSLFR
jgi:acetylornithine deacetylase